MEEGWNRGRFVGSAGFILFPFCITFPKTVFPFITFRKLNTCTMPRKILLKSINRLCVWNFFANFLIRTGILLYKSSCPLTMGKCTVLVLVLWFSNIGPIGPTPLIYSLWQHPIQRDGPARGHKTWCNVNMSPTDVSPIVVPCCVPCMIPQCHATLYETIPSLMIITILTTSLLYNWDNRKGAHCTVRARYSRHRTKR
jgi:hypothetical protein